MIFAQFSKLVVKIRFYISRVHYFHKQIFTAYRLALLKFRFIKFKREKTIQIKVLSLPACSNTDKTKPRLHLLCLTSLIKSTIFVGEPTKGCHWQEGKFFSLITCPRSFSGGIYFRSAENLAARLQRCVCQDATRFRTSLMIDC